jgi:hypothetical protein
LAYCSSCISSTTLSTTLLFLALLLLLLFSFREGLQGYLPSLWMQHYRILSELPLLALPQPLLLLLLQGFTGPQQ